MNKKNIVVIIGPEYEDSEYMVPKRILEDAGYELTNVGTVKNKKLKGKRGKSSAKVDMLAENAAVDQFDGLLIPGGYSPDHLRSNHTIISLISKFYTERIPIAAICHGPQLLIEGKLVNGKRMTSSPTIKTDLENAGAIWIDEPVIIEQNLITSRGPEDLDVFCFAFIKQMQLRNLPGFQ